MRTPLSLSLLLAFAAALAGCQSVNDMMKAAPRPTARIAGTSLQGLTLEHVDLVFDVEVSNPYPASLPLLDLSYAMASGGQKIVEGSVKPSSSVPASGKKVLQLPASIRSGSAR